LRLGNRHGHAMDARGKEIPRNSDHGASSVPTRSRSR
jgi:hypothetical protein